VVVEVRGAAEADVLARRQLILVVVLKHDREPRSQLLALVGHNGAGKTTFIKLLSGLYEPTEGRILLDGRDLRSYPREQLRARLSVVFQDYNQYQLSARENVGFGSAAHLDDHARVDAAIEHGGASELVAALPHGVRTQLGRWFQGGVDLSGGQWQRIALARAFMRRESDILVLDEPTAALDIDAEGEVFERVRKLAERRTLILISHRFANVRMADRIVVLERSGVIEDGTHAQLLARDGVYAAMFRKQARGYAEAC
ncbi:MAG TPA: ABC transporter ATP-binding protein, partial [Enhygromyxa sp.]|nr:ABC transporter ATP-binding protein [Enhygromyxa sp.]